MRTEPQKKKRRNLPEADRKRLILDAALKEFAAFGYDSCNVDRIADTAGVGKGTIYRHFPSKIELFTAVVERGHRELHERFEETHKLECELERHMTQGLTQLVDFFVEFPDYYRVMMVEQPELRLKVALDSEAGYDHFVQEIAETVKRETRAGILKRCDPIHVAQMFLALMKVIVERQLYGTGHSRQKDIRECVEITLKGLIR